MPADQTDCKESKVLLAQPVYKEFKVLLAQPAYKVLSAQPALLVQPGYKELSGQLALLAQPEELAQLVLRVRPACKVLQAHREYKEK